VTVSTAFRQSAYAPETADVWLALVTIDHDDLAEPIRVVNNTENITSRGDLFVGFQFELTLPDEREEAASHARITMDNVSREIAESVRSISSAPTVTLEVIRADDPDTVEMSWPFYRLRNVTWNALKVSGDLVLDDFTSEPYPAGNFTPASWPGLF
jgi:hypothetical protein